MLRQYITVGKLPDAPGVYFFVGQRTMRNEHGQSPKKILYIGRATSLRNRVRSYFTDDIAEKRGAWIAKMLIEARRVDFKKTDSVLEAILLEADLIKKFKPPYNTELKDDRSFNCVVITKEAYPAVFIARQTEIDFVKLTAKGYKLKAIYGPFPHGFQLQTALKIIRRIFPYRDAKCVPCFRQRRPHQQHTDKLEFVSVYKPCFSRQVGLCPGTCTGEISKAEYAKTIRNLRLFFEGKKVRLLALLQKEMKVAASQEKFERAGEMKRQLFALKHIQDVALLKDHSPLNGYSYIPRNVGMSAAGAFRIEAYDLSHFGGREIVGAMAVVEDGVAKPSEYRLFKLRGIKSQHEAAGLREIIRRRFNHPEWAAPRLIVVDGNEVQRRTAETVLSELGYKIPVVAVVKDERHRPCKILGANILGHLRQSASSYPRSSAILLANSEAHRFALAYHRRTLRRRLM